MKKVLLALVVTGIAAASFAQQTLRTRAKADSRFINLPYTATDNRYSAKDKFNNADLAEKNSSKAYKNNPQAPVPQPLSGNIQIGETIYDLQSNSAMPRRLINYGNGTLSAIWTTSTNDSLNNYQDRGTGYNHFDGTSWILDTNTGFPLVITNRFETKRTGFPGLGLLKNQYEYILAHDTSYGFYASVKDTASAGPWVSGSTAAGHNSSVTITSKGSIWNRMAIGGPGDSTVHVISNYADSVSLKINSEIKINGVKRPMVYSRSLDGGMTWTDNGITLPGYDSTRTLYGAAEDYAIDASGDNVAIVLGGLGEDVTLWKSTDNGANFTRVFVDSFPYAPNYEAVAPMGDTTSTNDGSVGVLIDNNGMVHVAYGYTEIFMDTDQQTGKPASFFRPGMAGLAYWNETADSVRLLNVFDYDNDGNLDATIDLDGNGNWDIGGLTTNSRPTTQYPGAARYGNNALLNKPVFSTDAAGNIYIVFSLPQDGDSTLDGQSFRDIWVVASQDGGTTWGPVQNLTCTMSTEEAFASSARLADGYLHLLYQEDFEPGTALTNKDPDGPNAIKYTKVNTADILAGTAGCTGNGIKIMAHNDLFSVSGNYPNPFSGTTSFAVNLKKNADVSISVSDMLGQKVLQVKPSGNLAAGTYYFNIDCSGLSAGVYFYTVKAGDYSITKKMIAE